MKNKMDRKLISITQRQEIDSIIRMLKKKNPGKKVDRAEVKAVRLLCGRSRAVNYRVLQQMDYQIPWIKPLDSAQQKRVKDVLAKMTLSVQLEDQKFKNHKPFA